MDQGQILHPGYSPGLVAVSITISMMAAYAAFGLADRMRSAENGRERLFWLAGGSSAMGLGIWCMHYLGMLAVRMPLRVEYAVPQVVLSLLLGMAAAMIALLVVSSRRLSGPRLLIGGVLMGAGIGGMHYVGMAAMRMQAMHHYQPAMVALSVVVAVVFSWIALWLGFALNEVARHGRKTRLLGGAVMGLGIAAMHYTAMAGVTYTLMPMPASAGWTLRIGSLQIGAIALVTVFVLIGALGSAAVDRRQYRELKLAQERLLSAQEELLRQQRELIENREQLMEANALLNELSIRDGLTGLHNRRHFDATFATEWRRASRRAQPLSLLLIDIDHFKHLNDTFGHQQGDNCLRELAQVLEVVPFRGHDVVARYGGEEFVVLLPGTDSGGAIAVAERLREAIKKHFASDEPSSAKPAVTVSVGVCSRIPALQDNPQRMLRDADTALYTAKQNGRNRVEVAPELPFAKTPQPSPSRDVMA